MARATEAIPVGENQDGTLDKCSPDPRYVARDGIMLLVNQAAVRLFGAMEADDLIGTFVLDRVHPAFREAVTALQQRVADGDSLAPGIEVKCLRLDGSTLDVEVEGTAIVFDGEPAIQATLTDISARRSTVARRSLSAWIGSEEIFHNLVETAADGFWLLDAQFLTVYVNPAIEQMLGYTRQEMVGRAWDSFGDAEWMARARELEERRVAGVKEPHEFLFIRKDGSKVLTRIATTPLHDDEGNFDGALGIVSDITKQKETGEAALRLSDERFQLLFDRATDGILVLTTEGRIVAANESFARMHGCTVSEMSVMSLKDLDTPASSQGVAERMRRLLAGEALTFEVEHRKKDGLVFPLEVSASLITSSGGDALIQAFHRDITARKQAEAERAALEARFLQSQKLESVGLLAGGVAHDFNNMLGVILGNTELALEQVDPAQPIHDDLMEVRKAAIRSAGLTQQLLAFARKQPVEPRVLDLNATIPGMLAMLRRLIGEEIELQWQPTPALWPILMDPSQMDQVLTNMCVNARQAIAGVGAVTIATANCVIDAPFCATHADAVPGEYVQITVRDSGRGMDEATLLRIFEPFFTTKVVGEGTGLGLATVHGAVRQNGGFLTAASAPGLGTTFEIYLPRHAGPLEPVLAAPTVGGDACGTETILLLEDEAAIMRVAAKALEARGYTVLRASRPSEAIRVAREFAGDIQLLLSDVVMPEMSGRDLADVVVARRPQVKLLFMSGHSADAIATRGILMPGLPFLQKPFSPETLAAKVRAVLDGP